MLLAELERLYSLPEITKGFPSKEDALAWANQVAPLLKFNDEYYRAFVTALDDLHADISSYSVGPRWRLMMSQVQRAIAELKNVQSGALPQGEAVKLATPGGTYIHPRRLQELSSLCGMAFDLTKLLQLLNEINTCHHHGCYFAVAALVRSVIDHVPPIFGFITFSQVASNYAGGRSFKETMERLDKSARTIADQHLHSQIRKAEVIPTINQVDFSNEIDVLLGEIVRILKQ